MEYVIVFNKTTGNTTVNGNNINVSGRKPFNNAKFNKLIESISQVHITIISRVEDKVTKDVTIVCEKNAVDESYGLSDFIMWLELEIHDYVC